MGAVEISSLRLRLRLRLQGEVLVCSLDGSGICGNIGRNLFQRDGTALGMELFANFNDAVSR